MSTRRRGEAVLAALLAGAAVVLVVGAGGALLRIHRQPGAHESRGNPVSSGCRSIAGRYVRGGG